MHPALVVSLLWIALSLGFLAGCAWAGRTRTGVRERRGDDPYGLTPEARERIWGRIVKATLPDYDGAERVTRKNPNLTSRQIEAIAERRTQERGA